MMMMMMMMTTTTTMKAQMTKTSEAKSEGTETCLHENTLIQ
jgi:hypothetical protein